MTGRQEYDRTKDRQRILGKYMIDTKNIYLMLQRREPGTDDCGPLCQYADTLAYSTTAQQVGNDIRGTYTLLSKDEYYLAELFFY